ncbi:hypothetical protein Ae201684P_019208 [Aphanomyces euteiches]|uniref:Uncharacterized protein n=1 Tax=Aphanomyces euteiches TaxID=100861 RepID=A0A6G0WJ70_9STRA|nr:hypothetical protein Ae201684_014657 [Aphanomyces euteiches]KAH9078107.1 hypothetical protein Ae201684P_019208 [Aphanomyces euteiches]
MKTYIRMFEYSQKKLDGSVYNSSSCGCPRAFDVDDDNGTCCNGRITEFQLPSVGGLAHPRVSHSESGEGKSVVEPPGGAATAQPERTTANESSIGGSTSDGAEFDRADNPDNLGADEDDEDHQYDYVDVDNPLDF